MIKFKVEGDLIRIVSHDVEYEKNLLLAFFKKKSKAAAFNVMVDRGLWDGFDKFVSKDDTIAIGLWKEIERFSKTNGVNIEIEGLSDRVKMDLPKENYLRWVENLLSGVIDERGGPIEARDYQIEGAFRALNYRFCTQELATSAGKTLIFYLYNCFLRDMKVVDKKTKSLIIVPNISLVNQTAEKFHLYSVGKKPWSICTIGGSSRFDQDKFDDCELVISTYQSLMNLPPEIFEVFSAVNVDECLHPDTKITLADKSTKEICNISAGDKVLTTNDTTLKIEICEVEEVYVNLSKHQDMYEIELEDGNMLKITGNHKVKLIDGSYKRVDELTTLDEILEL